MDNCYLTGLVGFFEYIDEHEVKRTVCKEVYDGAVKLQQKYPDTTINDCLIVVCTELWGNASKKHGVLGEKKKSKWGFSFFGKKDE